MEPLTPNADNTRDRKPLTGAVTDGTFGAFYASLTVETAVAETSHHRATFMAATDEPAQELDMRVYAVDLQADLHDIRGMRDSHPAWYHPSNYAVSQQLAGEMWRGLPYGGIEPP